MLLLIDGNNLAWAGLYALERAMKPETQERRDRVAMLGLASTVLGAIARDGDASGGSKPFRATRVAICFDEGRPLRRREIFPAYQTGREGDPKFIEHESTILQAIGGFAQMASKMLPVEVIRGTNTEADDLIAGLVQAAPDITKRIVSTDRDFLQLIDSHTSVYAPVKKLVIDETNFFDAAAPKTSAGVPIMFPRERFLDYRALIGDPSDNLPGVPGIGALSAAKLLAASPLDDYTGEQAAFRAAQAVRAALGRKSDAIERAFVDGTATAVIERNRTLMDLRLPAPCWDQLDALTQRGRWDRAAFEQWYREEKITAVENTELFDRLESLALAAAS
jgi:5'-3' exonuclease